MLSPTSQRGSIIVPAAFAIVVGIILLGSAQLGWHFYMKREMQTAADLAALSAVQVLSEKPTSITCGSAKAAAKDVVVTHMPAAASDAALNPTVDCLWWRKERVSETSDGTVAAAPEAANAVRVAINQSYSPIIPNIFPGSGTTNVTASAVATLVPKSATFSIASNLITTNSDAPLMSLLKLVGLPVTLRSGPEGLANLTITPEGLLGKLLPGVNLKSVTPDQLVSLLAGTKATGSQILRAGIELLGRDSSDAAVIDLAAIADAINANVKLRDVTIPLFTSVDPTTLPADQKFNSLFGYITTDTLNAALSATVSVPGLIGATIENASNYGLAVKDVSLLGGLVKAKVGIVEPASYGTGGVGTMAYNSQVRVFIDINTDNAPLLPALFGLLGVKIRIPLTIDLSRAHGTITDIDCNATPRTVDIRVDSSLGQLCFAAPETGDPFSRTFSCSAPAAGPQSNIIVRLLHIDLMPKGLGSLPILGSTQTVRFNVTPDTLFPVTQSDDGNAGALGTMLNQWLNTVSNGLNNPALLNFAKQNDDYASLATKYLSAANYNLDTAINLLQNGNGNELAALGNWTVPNGVPYVCVLVLTCWKDGSVWTAYKSSVQGAGKGLVNGLLGTLLGGLLLTDCNGIVAGLNKQACMVNNLASYMRTNPAEDYKAPNYCGLVCTVLKPVVTLLTNTLDGIGKAVVQTVLRDTLGIRIGQTDVTLHALQCNRARLVY